MIITIENYKITGKKGDWVVSETKTVQDKKSKNFGDEVEADRRFFGRLYQALFYLLDCKLSDMGKVKVRKLIEVINVNAKEIKNIADELEKRG